RGHVADRIEACARGNGGGDRHGDFGWLRHRRKTPSASPNPAGVRRQAAGDYPPRAAGCLPSLAPPPGERAAGPQRLIRAPVPARDTSVTCTDDSAERTKPERRDRSEET